MGQIGGGERIITEKVANNAIASLPPEGWPAATAITRAKK